jgi:hypothetical protein
MPPADVVVDDWEIQVFDISEMLEEEQPPVAAAAAVGEDWDEELLVPAQGRMVYVGQGQSHFTHFHEPAPGMLYPKRRRKKKKKARSSLQPPPPPPPPAAEPAPIDWSDWEELCQFGPPEPPVPWEPEDWEAEIAASQWQPEDWDAEIAASQ